MLGRISKPRMSSNRARKSSYNLSQAIGNEMISYFSESNPRMVISGRDNEYFKSPQVSDLINDIRKTVYLTM